MHKQGVFCSVWSTREHVEKMKNDEVRVYTYIRQHFDKEKETTMKNAACVWCSELVKVADTYNDLQHKAVCSPICKAAELMFTEFWSDEEINRRAHYRELTEGTDYDDA